MFTLEVVVDKFGDDIAPYAVNLARNLTAAFWKYSGQADGDEDADEDDQGEQPSPHSGMLLKPRMQEIRTTMGCISHADGSLVVMKVNARGVS